jgi:hypothetical protein
LGCEEELDRLESVIKRLAADYSYMRKAEHECEVHHDRGMCDEYEIALASVEEQERLFSRVLGDLNRCIQRARR